MIAYLTGKLTFTSPAYVYIDTGGVGYHVNISLNTYSSIESLDTVKLFIHQHITDDSHSLYGFFDEEERAIFTHLISVSGVGPNTARVILSYMTKGEVKTAIIHENVPALNKVKGIGPKTAKRIILDLKEKMLKVDVEEVAMASPQDNAIADEALSALMALGFPKATVDKQIKAILNQQPQLSNVEELIKLVLKNMR